MRASARGSHIHVPSARLVTALAASALLAAAVMAPTVGAAGGQPSAGTAVVDGNTSEWDFGADHFSSMGAGGHPDWGNLYLRYDCETETLFALVLAADGRKAQQTRPEEAYLRLDGSGKLVSGVSGDFTWVNGDGELADGYEAAGGVSPGSHTLRAHVLIDDDSDDGYTPIDANVDLELVCEEEPTDEEPTDEEPTDEVQPTQGTNDPNDPGPTGDVDAATGKPRVTLPPTDSLGATEQSDSSNGMTLVLLALGATIATSVILTPATARRRRR
jgi:hypothetical protein